MGELELTVIVTGPNPLPPLEPPSVLPPARTEVRQVRGTHGQLGSTTKLIVILYGALQAIALDSKRNPRGQRALTVGLDAHPWKNNARNRC